MLRDIALSLTCQYCDFHYPLLNLPGTKAETNGGIIGVKGLSFPDCLFQKEMGGGGWCLLENVPEITKKQLKEEALGRTSLQTPSE